MRSRTQCFELAAAGVQRGGHTRRAAANDDDVPQLSGRRSAVQGHGVPIREYIYVCATPVPHADSGRAVLGGSGGGACSPPLRGRTRWCTASWRGRLVRSRRFGGGGARRGVGFGGASSAWTSACVVAGLGWARGWGGLRLGCWGGLGGRRPALTGAGAWGRPLARGWGSSSAGVPASMRGRLRTTASSVGSGVGCGTSAAADERGPPPPQPTLRLSDRATRTTASPPRCGIGVRTHATIRFAARWLRRARVANAYRAPPVDGTVIRSPWVES